jgi:hypothetical protein
VCCECPSGEQRCCGDSGCVINSAAFLAKELELRTASPKRDCRGDINAHKRHTFYKWLANPYLAHADTYGERVSDTRHQWFDCVTHAVRTAFPDANAKYTGFRAKKPAVAVRNEDGKYDRERDRAGCDV